MRGPMLGNSACSGLCSEHDIPVCTVLMGRFFCRRLSLAFLFLCLVSRGLPPAGYGASAQLHALPGLRKSLLREAIAGVVADSNGAAVAGAQVSRYSDGGPVFWSSA